MTKLDNQLAYQRRTGRCPICGRESGVGVTCGSMPCTRKWLGMDDHHKLNDKRGATHVQNTEVE